MTVFCVDMVLPYNENQAPLYPVPTGRLGAQNSLLTLAQWLDKAGLLEDSSTIYSSYAVLDSLSSTYSMFKCGFDWRYFNLGNEFMHDALLMPENIITIVALALFLVPYSLLASLFEKEKEYDCCFKSYTCEPSPEEIETFTKATYVLTESGEFYYYPKPNSFYYRILQFWAWINNKAANPIKVHKIEVNQTQIGILSTVLKPQKYTLDGALTAEQLEAIRLCTNHTHWSSSFKKFIADSWPYVRDLTKALKNGYKGWRSYAQVLYYLRIFGDISKASMQTIYFGGIGLGLLATINRLLLRNMVEKRKVMMGQNAKLLTTLKKLTSLNADEITNYLNQLKFQSNQSRFLAYLGVAFGGVIDGLYLYVGTLTVVALAQPWLIALSALCIIFIISCVISRLYEEYDYQLRLEITHTKCKLVLHAKRLETLYCELEALYALPQTSHATLMDKHAEMSYMLAEFDKTRLLLESQLTRSYLTAGLLGLKNGLYCYSALNSILFFVIGIILLTPASVPPALLIASVIAGLALVLAFLSHSFIATYIHKSKQEENQEAIKPYNQLKFLNGQLNSDAPKLLDKKVFQEGLQAGFKVDASPIFFYQEWAEVIRSLFSGMSKGQKFTSFSLDYAQEKNDKGQWHDSVWMMAIGAANAVVFGLVFAGRALARGFGRLSIGCGLLRVEGEVPDSLTLEELEPLVKERNTVLLFDNNTMIYVDLTNGTINPIPMTESNQDKFEELTLRMSKTYKLADEVEGDLIETLTDQKIEVENDLAGAVGSILNLQPKPEPLHNPHCFFKAPNALASNRLIIDPADYTNIAPDLG